MLQRLSQPLLGGIVLVLLVGATLFSVTMSSGLLQGGYQLSADFTDAAGLSPGDSVLVAGVRVGSVNDVAIDGDHARATFQVDADLPHDTRAEIVLRNFLGKRALFLRPGDDWDQLLEGGDHIPLERTDTPVDFHDLNQAVTEVVHQQDIDALSQLVGTLADTTAGTAEDVGRLLDGLDRVTAVIAEQKSELSNVISDTRTVVDALADNDQQIVTIVEDFGAVLDRLAARRADLQRLLEETASTTTEGAALLDDVRPQLDRVLVQLHEDLEIVDAHQVDLAHVLAYGGVSFWGFANTFRAGNGPNGGWQNVMVTSQGPIGVDHLIGCGGVLDDVLDDVLGPDPRTCEEQAGQPSGGDQAAVGGEASEPAGWPSASLRSMLEFARLAASGGAR